jgi:hypothetical protein
VQNLPVHQKTVVFETFLAIFLESYDGDFLLWYVLHNIYFPLQFILKIKGCLFNDAGDSETISLYVVLFARQSLPQVFFESLIEET